MKALLITRSSYLKIRELIKAHKGKECFAVMSGLEGPLGITVYNIYNVTTIFTVKGKTGKATGKVFEDTVFDDAETKKIVSRLESDRSDFIGLFQTNPNLGANTIDDADRKILELCFEVNENKPISTLRIDPFADDENKIVYAFKYSPKKSEELVPKLFYMRKSRMIDFPTKSLKNLVKKYA